MKIAIETHAFILYNKHIIVYVTINVNASYKEWENEKNLSELD